MEIGTKFFCSDPEGVELNPFKGNNKKEREFGSNSDSTQIAGREESGTS